LLQDVRHSGPAETETTNEHVIEGFDHLRIFRERTLGEVVGSQGALAERMLCCGNSGFCVGIGSLREIDITKQRVRCLRTFRIHEQRTKQARPKQLLDIRI
jgi:hypothetical protein